MSSIGAVILAAGASRRLGEAKQFLRHRGETLLRLSVRAAIEAGLTPCVVVSGAVHELVATELAGCNICLIRNAHWKRGIGSSLRTACERLLEIAPHLESTIVLVCDQPYVSAEVLRSLIEKRSQLKLPMAACAYGGTYGVPALFAQPLFAQLLALPDEAGAKHLLMKQPELVAVIDFPMGIIDIDTPEDRDTQLQSTSNC